VQRGICDGLNVLEMGAGSVAAAIAGTMFADNAARVIKIEPPEGDRLRTLHPSAFLAWNRGKESAVADLRTDEGRAAFRELAANADVVLDGFAPGRADGWGIGWEALRAINPGLVYCSITGFGTTGPYSRIRAYDAAVMAKAGVLQLGLFAYRSGPIMFSALLASVGAGHMATAAVCAALTARTQTGTGQYVEATMVQGLNPLDYFNTMGTQLAARSGMSSEETRNAAMKFVAASRYSMIMPTKDGRWVATTQMLPHQARALSRACGLEHTFDDPVYGKQPQFASAEDAEAWENLIWEAMKQQPYEYWEKAFLAEPDIAFELCRFSEEGLDHPQIRHNSEVATIDDPDVGSVELVGPVAQFSELPAQIARSAPRPGQNAGPFAARAPLAPSGAQLPHALSGCTIVEMGYFYAMPYGVTMTGALGARVIKIEPKAGDPMRTSFGAPDSGAAKTMEGKESISLDLQTAEGQEIARKLAASATVFVNGFRTGVAEKMGLDYESLRQLNPDIVYVHATGYGTSGPRSSRPIYAQVAQAVAGSINRYGGRWMDPNFAIDMSVLEAQLIVLPRVRGVVDGDSNAALAVASTLGLAIYDRANRGTGQFAATTMIGGNAWAYADDFIRYAGKPALPLVDEDGHGLNALYRLYKVADGWVFLGAPLQTEWDRLVGELGLAELTDDPRFTTPADRLANDDALTTALTARLAAESADALETRLTAAGVCCVRAYDGNHSMFTINDPVMRETGLTAEVEHPRFGHIVRHGLLAKLSDTPGRLAAGCLNGQHTEAILAELGYSSERIQQLLADGVAFTAS
jgi:crotonobetainyl-CoA:carnitine CoA-transferase CaiB-like acyl-CoA transferase